MDIAVIIGIGLAAVAAVAAGVVIPPTRRASRPAEVAENIAQFRRKFTELSYKQANLNEIVLQGSPAIWKTHGIPMLTSRSWIFDHPVPVEAIRLKFRNTAIRSQTVDVPKFRGLDLAGPMTYSDAVTKLAGMNHFTNGVIYRPVRVDFGGSDLCIEFDEARYFDYLDSCEVLAYLESSSAQSNEYRKRLGNPFDLSNRVTSLGILTLTVQQGPTGAEFILHKRTSKVVLGAELFHVIPAGEFTPSDISLAAVREDLDLWRNISREYAEELLGDEDAQGYGGRRIDYRQHSPYRELSDAIRTGGLRLSAFGLGLDPLTWKPELLTVAVFDAEVFNGIFSGRIVGNYEGKVIEHVPFVADSLERYLADKNVRFGAKACLKLAWDNRAELGLL